MARSVRNKIWLGTAFLFALLLLTGGVGIYFTYTLKEEAKSVLQDNYESVSYCHQIQQQLDSVLYDYPASLQKMKLALDMQERNITERGEMLATTALRHDFDLLKAGDSSARHVLEIQQDLQRIIALNMLAIHQKNNKAQRTAESAMTIIIVLTGFLFLVAFAFSVNFPSVVVRPIRHFLEAIGEISNKNYAYRIRMDNKDEFGDLAHAFNDMTARLQYFESSNLNKLMQEKSRAEAVINSLQDASIGIDKDNRILFANSKALQLLGLAPGAIVDRSVDEVADKNELFGHLLKRDSSVPFKIIIGNKENYFVKEVIDVPLGENRNRVIVLKNITPFKELDVAKTNFIATISHELKTPLAASDLSLKLLEDGRIGHLSAEQMELIQNLKQDNQRVLRILSEMLNMSQVEAGKIELDVQPVDPYLIIDHAVDTVSAAARERDIRIARQVPADLPLVRADAEKSTWVLNNFLTNAIKNANAGTVVVVRAQYTDTGVQFSVQDQGPGIAQEYLPRLFERYFKVPGSSAKGTGLGLGISKEFIEAQNGSLHVESEMGKGSVFSFTLPRT